MTRGAVSGWIRLLAAWLTIAAASACGRPSVEEVETSAVVPVTVATAATGVLQSVIAATGIVTAAPGAELIVVAPASARIARLPHAEGDRVSAGDVIVTFDIPSLAADVASARARITQATARIGAARASVARLSSLLEQGVAAPRDVEDAKRQQAEAEGDLEQAQSALEAAQSLSDRAVVRAPFAGVIAQRFHNPGDLVEPSASDPVLKLINPSQLQIVASIPASELRRVVVGRRAQVRVAGHDDGEEARVLTRAAQVDPATATGSVRLAFAGPTALTAGMPVEVAIVGDEHRNVVVVPAAAVVREDGSLFVMVAGADNKAHKRPVAVGLSTRTQVEITKGLAAGDLVIVRGQEGLPDGAAIAVESS